MPLSVPAGSAAAATAAKNMTADAARILPLPIP